MQTSLDDEELTRNGKHVLVTYTKKPRVGYGSLATVAHLAAESSRKANVNACTTSDSTQSAEAPGYYTDPDDEEMRLHIQPCCSIAT
jgi:ribulose-bisphosphate carboxylase large chain